MDREIEQNRQRAEQNRKKMKRNGVSYKKVEYKKNRLYDG